MHVVIAGQPRTFPWIDGAACNWSRTGRRPDRKVHEANMGPIRGRQDQGGPHVGPMNVDIWGYYGVSPLYCLHDSYCIKSSLPWWWRILRTCNTVSWSRSCGSLTTSVEVVFYNDTQIMSLWAHLYELEKLVTIDLGIRVLRMRQLNQTNVRLLC